MRFAKVTLRNLSIFLETFNVRRRFRFVTTLVKHFIIHVQKTDLCAKFAPPIWRHCKTSLPKYGRDVTTHYNDIINPKQVKKKLVNTNPHAKFSVPMTSSLEVR